MLVRAHMPFGLEPFHVELTYGIEDELAQDGRSVVLQCVPDHDQEHATYRRWAHDRSVAAVVLVNLAPDDPRPALLDALGLPAVVLLPASASTTAPHVSADDSAAARVAADRLLALGHRCVGRVAGPAELLHTRARTAELSERCAAAGATTVTALADYTAEEGARATRELLAASPRPTAIVYDNDVMAAAGVEVATALGLRIPDDLSIVAWDDSVLCRLTTPPLTVLSVDVHEIGVRVGAVARELLHGGPVEDRTAPPHVLVERGSTGPAPTR